MEKPKPYSDYVFVSAIPEELAGLAERLPDLDFLSLGVGNLEASLHLLEYLNKNPHKKNVFFLGSCGTYNPEICPYPGFARGGSCYMYRELSEFKKISHVPDLLPKTTNPGKTTWELSVLQTRPNFPEHSVNSPNSLSLVNPSELPDFPGGLVLENMEVFGLARVCEKMNLYFTSVFAVTNRVGREGSREWRENYKVWAEKLNLEIANLLLLPIH